MTAVVGRAATGVPVARRPVPPRPCPAAGAPLPRLRPVPCTDPPPLPLPGRPGEEVDGWRTARQPGPGQQVLALTTRSTPRRRAPLDEEEDPLVAPTMDDDDAMPDPTATCAALAGAVVEVLSGHRPVAQLVRWTTADVQQGLARRAALATRLRPAPRRGPARAGRPAVVRAVRVCRPAEGVVEASAVVVDGPRVRAVALRLEGWDRRWRATAVEVG